MRLIRTAALLLIAATTGCASPRSAVAPETNPEAGHARAGEARYRLRNPAAHARAGVVVALPLPPGLQLAATLRAIDAASGTELPLQRLAASDEPGDALVQLDLPPRAERVVLLREAAAAAQPARVFGRPVPERKDDFAWENDRIAFRMYGPALAATGEVSSGIDVWAKRTRALVIDRWYAGGDYHVDHGEGMDFYQVGPSRGCGGIAMRDAERTAVSGNYVRARVLATGPLRVVFELDYAPWGLPGQQVAETKRISLDAGSHFSRIVSRFSTPDGGRAPALPLAAGIGSPGAVDTGPDGRWISVWGDEQPGKGRIACALVMPAPGVKPGAGEGQQWLSRTLPAGETLAYYAGATWSNGLDARTRDQWNAQVAAFADELRQPIEVHLLR